MGTEPEVVPARPVPRWLFRLSLATVACAPTVLLMGALTTTFGVGMSDPVPSTDPWYLAVNSRVWLSPPARGFLLEHTHRLFAWAIGLFTTLLAVGAWRTEPDARLRRFGTLALAGSLVAYAGLHGEMRLAWDARQAGEGLRWPAWAVAPVLLGMAALLGACVGVARGTSPGKWVRVFATVALVLVMLQGLLGGFRVYLDQLMGTQLAAIHGTVAQVTTAVLVAVAALAAPIRAGREVEPADARALEPVAAWLVVGVVAQLVWGVWMRHLASPVAQRLHILTAFAVTGLIVWACVRILSSPSARRALGFFAYLLIGVVAVQLALGVEAYLGKFALAGEVARLPVHLRPVTEAAAAVRTVHTLVGAALLASAVVLLVRVRRGLAAEAVPAALPWPAARATAA